jgi:CHAT domain-containing protein
MGIVENATGDLWFTPYECENIAKIYGVAPTNRLIYQQATPDSYRHLARQVHILHSSHHARANLISPLDSKLYLFGGEVTLGEILTWRLPDLLEVFLSCCETGFALGKLNDDILTIAAGWLCAGARSVVSTLWAVDDFATALFCIFYYQLRREQPLLARSEALRQAQFQLRGLAGDELNNKYRPSLEQFLRQRETPENKEEIEKRLTLLEWMCQQPHPFEDPVYWGAFVSQGMN